MRVIGMIFGFLLMLFGGGCTLVFLLSGAPSQFLLIWIFVGLLPLFLGFYVGRSAGKSGQEKPKPPKINSDADWPP
ncbi:MAG: hypothetical protein ABL936_20610 [Aestuariivirga sp.]